MSSHLLSWSAFGAANVSFCEARIDQPIAEPANAWSSMIYVAIGLWILVRAGRKVCVPVALVGITGVLIGAGSFALHATASFLGQFVDEASMFLFSALTLTLALRRLVGWRPADCLLPYVAIAVASTVLLAMARQSGIPVFGLQMTGAVGMELFLLRRDRDTVRDRALTTALVALVTGFGVWALDFTRVVCSTQTAHLLNGHALWHALTAASLGAYGFHQEQFFGATARPQPVLDISTAASIEGRTTDYVLAQAVTLLKARAVQPSLPQA